MKPTRELVLKILGEYWPASQNEVLAELDEIVSNESSVEGLARIQLAVLKLADGRRDKLADYIEAANADPRDVLAYAEYPGSMRAPHLAHFRLNEAEKKESNAIRKSDRAQYLAWLNRFAKQ